MFHRGLHKLPAAFAMTCLLSTCGGGNPPEDALDVGIEQETENSDDLELFGRVFIGPSGEPDLQTEVEIEFDFVDQSGITPAEYSNFIDMGFSTDTCDSAEIEVSSELSDLFSRINEQGVSVSAGNVVNINSGTNLFTSIEESISDGKPYYA